MVKKFNRVAVSVAVGPVGFCHSRAAASDQSMFPGRFPGNLSLSHLLRAELLKGKNLELRNSERSPSRLQAMLQLNRSPQVTSPELLINNA